MYHLVFRLNGPLVKLGFVEWYLKRSILKELEGDKALARALTPSYLIGCKRITFGTDYLKCFKTDNVSLINGAAAKVKGKTVISASGEEVEVDILVLATGFNISQAARPFDVDGDGFKLRKVGEDSWRDEPRAYLGISHPGKGLVTMSQPQVVYC